MIRAMVLAAVAVSVCLCGTGCATKIKPSDFLADCEPHLGKGEYLNRWWTSPDLKPESLQKVWIAPVDVSRVQDAKKIPKIAVAELLEEFTDNLFRDHEGWGVATTPGDATVTLQMAITRLDPGDRVGRILAGELGMWNAVVQVEGKFISPQSNQVIGCWADQQKESATAGFEDVVSEMTRKLFSRTFETITKDLAKELEADFKHRGKRRFKPIFG